MFNHKINSTVYLWHVCIKIIFEFLKNFQCRSKGKGRSKGIIRQQWSTVKVGFSKPYFVKHLFFNFWKYFTKYSVNTNHWGFYIYKERERETALWGRCIKGVSSSFRKHWGSRKLNVYSYQKGNISKWCEPSSMSDKWYAPFSLKAPHDYITNSYQNHTFQHFQDIINLLVGLSTF